jgi:hypothetical protein
VARGGFPGEAREGAVGVAASARDRLGYHRGSRSPPLVRRGEEHDPPRAPQWFSLLRNTAHSNVSHIFLEGSELLPAENTLTIAAGFIGAYPNAIYRVRRAELPALTAAIRGLASEDDYRRLADRFAVRRTDPGFWAASDAMIDAYARSMPLAAGLFDYNRLENR